MSAEEPIAGVGRQQAATTRGVGSPGQVARVVAELRGRIIEGQLRPGDRLTEDDLGGELKVSRNTLREAFRLLSHEGLAVHRLNRGVFVPQPTLSDLEDLYRIRKMIEPPLVASLQPGVVDELSAVEETVIAAEKAGAEGRWTEVVTANMRFHQGVVALGGSPRLDGFMRAVLAETRLAFYVVSDLRAVYGPYVGHNRTVFEGIAAGRFQETAAYLHNYLVDSEAALREAFVRHGGWPAR